MKRDNIKLLDCTLRDGAYIVDGKFGDTIGGIIKNLQDSRVDLIEVGWLKDFSHRTGTSYYHTPNDIRQYLLSDKNPNTIYLAMIDYNRYDLNNLPENDGKSIDAIRVVFPHGKVEEGCKLVEIIKSMGYQAYLQAANTLAYSDLDLLELADAVNKVKPVGISIVDTFGSMYPEDLERIYAILNNNLDLDIALGFHSHNNMQMSYALSMQFADKKSINDRLLIVDSSLCGMGRGAGNTPTELLSSFLNKRFHTDYDLNIILDTIDIYMTEFQKKYSWGYSMPYLVAGLYQCHVNNVAFLSSTHSVKSKDMKMIFSSMTSEERRKYDYDLLEEKYQEYVNNEVDDHQTIDGLKEKFENRDILVVLPGRSAEEKILDIIDYAEKHDSLIVGINSVLENYQYDYLFFTNNKKYQYAKENNVEKFDQCQKILMSNIKTEESEDGSIVNYNDYVKLGWKFYDNAFILFLRLLKRLNPASVSVAGFDGYKGNEDKQYSKRVIKNNLPVEDVMQMHNDIEDMMKDFVKTNVGRFDIHFVTKSPFEHTVIL